MPLETTRLASPELLAPPPAAKHPVVASLVHSAAPIGGAPAVEVPLAVAEFPPVPPAPLWVPPPPPPPPLAIASVEFELVDTLDSPPVPPASPALPQVAADPAVPPLPTKILRFPDKLVRLKSSLT